MIATLVANSSYNNNKTVSEKTHRVRVSFHLKDVCLQRLSVKCMRLYLRMQIQLKMYTKFHLKSVFFYGRNAHHFMHRSLFVLFSSHSKVWLLLLRRCGAYNGYDEIP